MRHAQRLGMSTTATMMYGHVETLAERVEHMRRIRELQDETRGFRAFISWTFQDDGNRLGAIVPPETRPTSFDYLLTQAVSRIYLDNVDHIQSSWVTQGMKIGQVALEFGADDLGSIMIEENVVSAAGTTYRASARTSCARSRRSGRRGAARHAVPRRPRLELGRTLAATRLTVVGNEIEAACVLAAAHRGDQVLLQADRRRRHAGCGSTMGPFEIWVGEEDVERARELLAERDSRGAALVRRRLEASGRAHARDRGFVVAPERDERDVRPRASSRATRLGSPQLGCSDRGPADSRAAVAGPGLPRARGGACCRRRCARSSSASSRSPAARRAGSRARTTSARSPEPVVSATAAPTRRHLEARPCAAQRRTSASTTCRSTPSPS